ncbi:MAG TPA: hypothetical protein VIJ66_11555 [Solirubrobacteraceae bacterium]
MPGELEPGAVARRLFGIDPDRDERASQLCMEALLTLAQNEYRAPSADEELASPKRRQFAIRSLALGHNFLELFEEGRIGSEGLSPQRYGELLATGSDLLGSANLNLARDALQGLVDPSTSRGQAGGWLLRPFHESLLWFDARQTRARPWTVRQVYMRGSGVTFARMLVEPPDTAGAEAADSGRRAVDAIRDALRAPSPLGDIAVALEGALPDDLSRPYPPEAAELRAWEHGGEPELGDLSATICRHAEGVMLQGTASAPARLWQLRSIMALDFAAHVLRSAWDRLELDERSRYVLASFGGPPRRDNRLRQLSERSYADARQQLRRATVATLADEMRRLNAAGHVEWDREVLNRGDRLNHVLAELTELSRGAPPEEYDRLARLTADNADYGRAAEGFRVLIESVGLLAGTGAYRYMSPTPELLSALVGALSRHMPMTSAEFFDRVRAEWGLVIGPGSGARVADELDGVELERNARRAEAVLSNAGLALGLSDRTVVVGERAAWEGRA